MLKSFFLKVRFLVRFPILFFFFKTDRNISTRIAYFPSEVQTGVCFKRGKPSRMPRPKPWKTLRSMHWAPLADVQHHRRRNWNVRLLLRVHYWIKGFSVCPFCPRSVACSPALGVFVRHTGAAGYEQSQVFAFAFIFSEVFARSAVIAVARLGNQILFIASRLFQHIPMMINRGTGVV